MLEVFTSSDNVTDLKYEGSYVNKPRLDDNAGILYITALFTLTGRIKQDDYQAAIDALKDKALNDLLITSATVDPKTITLG